MSGAEVARRPAGALAVTPEQTEWTEPQAAALEQLGISDAPRGDQLVFLGQAQRTGLDPFARQLYMIGRKDRDAPSGKKWTVQASIDGLRVVAQRSGTYRGQVGPQWCGPDGVWSDVWLHQRAPLAARVGVLREGWPQPMYAVAHFTEYAATFTDRQSGTTRMTGQWGTKPALMLAKCAEALALRKAFPHDLSGVYTAEEMGQADAPAVVPGVVTVSRPEPAPDPVEVAPSRDWHGEVAGMGDLGPLQQLWSEARAAGALDHDLAEHLKARAGEIVDAERAAAEVAAEDQAAQVDPWVTTPAQTEAAAESDDAAAAADHAGAQGGQADPVDAEVVEGGQG